MTKSEQGEMRQKGIESAIYDLERKIGIRSRNIRKYTKEIETRKAEGFSTRLFEESIEWEIAKKAALEIALNAIKQALATGAIRG